MTISRRLRIVLLAGTVGFIGLGAPLQLTFPGANGIVSTAEARVGRPLTPVSVAGVARRSARRCAAGVTC
ncbi:hypothetical protein [Mesorhizobium delmotii]|uniref:Uncharacterized protein n=1 Tax=Mesorhizobium delmotii TaxID=1631247 RepID=A0A2P9AMM7_9HYPH|nr:hypothetical protein [Mesorhizobium delmotii]SJM32391.1 conserved hypothetical protein [Mesorhizobium delmotii]